jgi:hypothetical protein
MKKMILFSPLFVLLLLTGTCTIQEDVSEEQKEIEKASFDAEQKMIEVADLLAESGKRIKDSEEQQEELDAAIAEADTLAEEAVKLIAESQPDDLALYIEGIEEKEPPSFQVETGGSYLYLKKKEGKKHPHEVPSQDDWRLLAKAAPDEKFFGPCGNGNAYNPFYPAKPPEWWWDDGSDGWVPKTNEAYVWGMTKYKDKLFFGTGPNIHCLVLQGYLGYDQTILDEAYACEGSCSQLRDWRPPSLYMYDMKKQDVEKQCSTGTSTSVPAGVLVNLTETLPPGALIYLFQTVGIRSAGSHRGIAFLAGPVLQTSAYRAVGVNIFAFDSETGEFLAVKRLSEYNNIRKWVAVNDELYVGVGGSQGGAVLKWIGNRDNLFEFEVVGRGMDGLVSELCAHEGRIFATTWPGGTEGSGGISEAGLWMSPKLDPALCSDDQDEWEKVWSVLDYEPDPVIAHAYGGGALESYNGYLYWGTMHVPLTAALAHFSYYGEPEGYDEIIKALLGSWRAIAIFRGKNLDHRRWGKEIDLRWGKRTDPRFKTMHHPRWNKAFQPRWGKRYDPFCGKKIELLYGERFLPAFSPTKGWRLVPNKMSFSGKKPKYGHSGFGNIFNNYCWTMAVYDGKLFVGTMDWSYLLFGTLDLNFAGFDFSILKKLGIQGPEYGSDLYCFTKNHSEAEALSLNGMGNPMNYGIRTMVADGALYLGSANPMNLSVDGGWELIELKSH